MKIEDNRSNVRTFSDLIVGDWFECENNIYIKIDEKTNHLKYNAVDAETGEILGSQDAGNKVVDLRKAREA